jgi:hypothetical protein
MTNGKTVLLMLLLAVSGARAANLLTVNTSFETPTNGYVDETSAWIPIPGWAISFTSGGVFDYAGLYTLSPATGIDGARYLYAAGGPLSLQTSVDARAPVAGGHLYTLSFLADYPASGFRAGIRWYDQAGTLLGQDTFAPSVDGLSPQFQSFQFRTNAPASAVTAAASFTLNVGPLALDKVVLEPGSGDGSNTYSQVDYYVSSSGNDTNAGTLGQPWRTLARASQAVAPGVTIHLQGGAVFRENVSIGTGGAAGYPVVLTSDPTNRATLVQTNAQQPGVLLYNVGHITLENLVVVGMGTAFTTQEGVAAGVSGGTVAGLTLRHVAVSGFREGFHIYAAGAGSVCSDVRVENCVGYYNLHAGFETSATSIGGVSNIVVRDSVFSHNPGDPAAWFDPSGFGLVLGGTVDGVVERCVAHDNGGAGPADAGPVGFMTYHCRRITIQSCEAYNTRATNQDGDGFDLDLNTTDSTIQYCYAHDNFGAGYLLNTDGVAGHWWTNNVVRYNISENDAYGGRMGALHFYSGGAAAALMNSHVYGNTIYSRVSPVVGFYIGNMVGVALRNNVFWAGGTNALMWWAQSPASSPTPQQARFQGNCYWTGGATHRIAGYASLDAWRAATGQETLNGTNVGFCADPLLTLAGSAGTNGNPRALQTLAVYQPRTNSPLIDAGLDLAALFGLTPGPSDFFGTAVPQLGGLDVGAAELVSAPPPVIAGLHWGAGGLTLAWPGTNVGRYWVEFTAAMAPTASWETLTGPEPVAGTNGLLAMTPTNAATHGGFYRVRWGF